jgi:RNA polymerase sigma-70 factor (ECF subfamily)
MTSDLELLHAWGRGDKNAGEELFRRHFVAVDGFFRVRLDRDVDDLTQRTFLACLESRGRFRAEGSFKAFLFGIARNLLLDHLRRAGQTPRTSSDAELAASAPSPSARVAQRQEQRLLLRALRRLPIDHQIALQLHYWEHLRGTEIAEVLGVAEGTVWSRLTRAKALLREQIEAVAESPALARSTVDDLERWAGAVRREVLGEDD